MSESIKPSFETLERRMLMSVAPVGPEFLVNTTTVLNQQRPDIAMDASGNFVVVWESTNFFFNTKDVFAQRFSADGVPLGEEIFVNTFQPNDQHSPKVAMDADGDFVVVWTSAGQDGSGEGIYAQRFNVAGGRQGGEFRVNTTTNNAQKNPAVTMDASGKFIVTWHSLHADNIYAQRYDVAGVSVGGEFLVNTNTIGTQYRPDVAMDADGDFVIAWNTFGQDGDQEGIAAQRSNSAGVKQGNEFRVNSITTSIQMDPAVAMDADGDFVIVWAGQGAGGNFGIQARRYTAAGLPRDLTEFLASTTFPQFDRTVAMDADGDFVIGWTGNDADRFAVWGRSFSANGVGGSGFMVNTYTPSDQRFGAVAMSSDGNLVFAWQSTGQEGPPISYGIYAQRYRSFPAVMNSQFRFQTKPHEIRFTFDQNVSASLSTADIVLQNLSTSQTIASSDLSVSYDSATNTATFTYTGNASGIAGVLPDGRYRATLLASGITNSAAAPLEQDHIFNFLFQSGDANNDGRVSLIDFNILAANFGLANRTFGQGDFNYDTIVNLSDFNILAGRFGTVLAAPDGESVFGDSSRIGIKRSLEEPLNG